MSAAPTDSVLVADDHDLFRGGMVTAINRSSRLHVVAEAVDGAQAAAAILLHRPRLALLDYRMPGMDGVSGWARAREQADPPLETVGVLLTANPNPDMVERARRAGIARVLNKELSRRAIVEACSELIASPAPCR